jgi:hypothetical protein
VVENGCGYLTRCSVKSGEEDEDEDKNIQHDVRSTAFMRNDSGVAWQGVSGVFIGNVFFGIPIVRSDTQMIDLINAYESPQRCSRVWTGFF